MKVEEESAGDSKPGPITAQEDDDVIPKIKSSHLDLDDIPLELLPKHQEKIMKQVRAAEWSPLPHI